MFNSYKNKKSHPVTICYRKGNTMRNFRTCLVVSTLFFIAIFYISPLMADEIHLKNGDRISGSLLNMKDNKLTIKTSYAGDIVIDWSQVDNIKTDQKLSVLLNDNTLINGSTRESEQGKMRLSTDNIVDTMSFPMADVKSINAPKKPSVKINTRVNIGVTVTSGNTDRSSTHFDGEFSARTAKNKYTAGVESDSSKENGVKTESNSSGYIKYDHFLSEKWFASSNALFEKDSFKDLNLRSTLGIGAGYQFFETPVTNLSIESGINYVDEDYITGADTSFSAGRWAVNYNRYFYNKAFQLFHFHEGYISLQDTNDMFIRSRTGIRVPLFAHINASLQYNLDWDKSPAPGRKKTDGMLMFTLGYQFEN